MAEPFADSAYYQTHGFGTPPADADVLLARASRLVRAECLGIDERIAAWDDDPRPEDALDPEVVSDIVCEMVQNVTAAANAGAGGVESSSQQIGSGPFQRTNTQKFSAPVGAMVLNRKHRRLLGCVTQQAFTVQMEPAYGSYDPTRWLR